MIMHKSNYLPHSTCASSRSRFHGNKSGLSASMPIGTVYCEQRGGNVHVAIILTHNDERDRIFQLQREIVFIAEELPTFSIKGSSCKTYSI